MENISGIIQQIKQNQTILLEQIMEIENNPNEIPEIVLRKLIQEAREIHEGSVLLSYLAFHNADTIIEEKPVDLKDSAPKNEVVIEEEISEEEQLINAHEIALEQTHQPAQSSTIMAEEIPSQETIVENLEAEISAVIQQHSTKSFIEEKQIEDNSLAARLAKQKIQNLMTAIGINEKFLFANELFDGKTELFLQTIQQLNDCADLKEAQTLLSQLTQKYSWNTEEAPFQKLNSLIERKF